MKTTAVNCNGWSLMRKHFLRFVPSKMRKNIKLPLTFHKAYVKFSIIGFYQVLLGRNNPSKISNRFSIFNNRQKAPLIHHQCFSTADSIHLSKLAQSCDRVDRAGRIAFIGRHAHCELHKYFHIHALYIRIFIAMPEYFYSKTRAFSIVMLVLSYSYARMKVIHKCQGRR